MMIFDNDNDNDNNQYQNEFVNFGIIDRKTIEGNNYNNTDDEIIKLIIIISYNTNDNDNNNDFYNKYNNDVNNDGDN